MNNKEFKGTPAPWNYNENFCGTVSSSNRTMVACVYPRDNEMNANAHLIAAAPELLQALQLIINYHDDGYVGLHHEDLALARKAITKATGTKG